MHSPHHILRYRSVHVIPNAEHSASHGSVDVLEHILAHEDCDVDPINRLEAATTLHLALQLEDPEMRLAVVESLLDAGADTRYAIPYLV